MQVYAIQDAVTGLFYRRAYDGRANWLKKPLDVNGDREYMKRLAKMVTDNWKRDRLKHKPKMKIVPYELTAL